MTSTTSSKSPSDESFNSFLLKNFGVIVMMVAVFIGGFFVGSLWQENKNLKSGKTAAVVTANQPAVPVAAAGPTLNFDKVPQLDMNQEYVRGNKDAKVVMVTYADFECPFCGKFHPTSQQVLKDLGDKVALVYRHYPLDFHPNAQKAAEAAECVAAQKGNDGFWNYSDAIFEVNQRDGKLSPEAIKAAALKAGVNEAAFTKCLDSGEMATKVKEMAQGGGAAGIEGTPATVVMVDGKAVDFIAGAFPLESVKSTLQKYLK